MKLLKNKKIVMFAGVGIVIIVIGVVGMRFMKSRKPPPQTQTAQTAPEGDNAAEESGTGTASLAKADKEKAKPKLPSSYKQRSTTTFKPLSSHEVATMLKEIETIKQEYAKRNELLDLREKMLESLRTDLNVERKQIDDLKRELTGLIDSVAEQKTEIQKKTILLTDAEAKNFKKLAAVYKDMKPEKAAMILKEMDDDTAVKLLTMMDDKTSAKVLEAFTPEHAVKLTEKLKYFRGDLKNGKK